MADDDDMAKAWGPRGPSASYEEWLEEGRDEEPPLEYTDADRAYDRAAFARDYGLREEWT